MTIFRDFQGPRPRRDIGMARPRHSKTYLETCLETETRLETSSSGEYRTRLLDSLLESELRLMVSNETPDFASLSGRMQNQGSH